MISRMCARVPGSVAAVDHVVVERDDHQRRIGDDATELARVERVELDRLLRAQRAKSGQDVVRAQYPEREIRGRRHSPNTSTAVRSRTTPARPWRHV